jgi:hypothetical protein
MPYMTDAERRKLDAVDSLVIKDGSSAGKEVARGSSWGMKQSLWSSN